MENNNASIPKKEDGRVTYTKHKIREAFYELLQTKGYSKITVTELCNKAEINRATFYKHYLDIPDLAEKLETEAINTFREGFINMNDDNYEDFVLEMLNFVKRDYMQIYSGDPLQNISSFTMKLSEVIFDRFELMLDHKEIVATDFEKKIIFAYISAGCGGIISYWIQSGFKKTDREIVKMITTLSKATLSSLPSHIE